MTDSTLAYGIKMIQALLGVDALDRNERTGEPGFVDVDLSREGQFTPESFGSWAEARVRFVELKAEATALIEADRRSYYDDLCHSTLAFAEWRDRGIPLAAQLRDFLHVPGEPASDTELDALRAAIGDRLDAMGYGGELSAKCSSWEEGNAVPAEEVESTLTGLLAEATARTQERLLALPDASGVLSARGVRGAPYTARLDYTVRTVSVNLDVVLTRPTLKRLAAREGAPGHYVQLRLREAFVARGEAAADVLLSLSASAGSCVYEGIANTGVELVDWIDTNDDRVQDLLSRYEAAITTGAAWRLHARGDSQDEVRAWLRAQALVGGEGWIDQCLATVGPPEAAVAAWAPWWGRRVVEPAWRKIHEARRPDLIRYLYGRMHSNASLGMFH